MVRSSTHYCYYCRCFDEYCIRQMAHLPEVAIRAVESLTHSPFEEVDSFPVPAETILPSARLNRPLNRFLYFFLKKKLDLKLQLNHPKLKHLKLKHLKRTYLNRLFLQFNLTNGNFFQVSLHCLSLKLSRSS